MLEPACLLPEQFVVLRPMCREDLSLLLRWINAGRLEGAFRMGDPATLESLGDYQAERGGEGRRYFCQVIECQSSPIGYVDYEHSSMGGEILGLYVEPRWRGKRIGRHLLRLVSAGLREEGCQRVSMEIYLDNTPSLRSCRAAGFYLEPSEARTEGGRALCRMARDLLCFKRFLLPASRYKELRGDNIYLHHIAIAEAISDHIKKIEGVEAILGSGSVGRGFADQWSDVDLVVLGRGAGIRELWRGESWALGLSLDLSVIDLDVAPPLSWDYMRRQALEEAVVLFESSPGFTDSLGPILHLGVQERTEQIIKTIFNLGWSGFQPRVWFGREVHGYRWMVPYDLWLRRGCIASAHMAVDQALDWTMQLVYLANRRHVPDIKWRRYLLPSLAWTPYNFHELIRQVEERGLDEVSFGRRTEALLPLIGEIFSYLESEGEISGDIYSSYMSSTLDY